MKKNISQLWNRPLSITENNFVNKSLSNWACNTAVGCEHACRFCYVPQVSTRRMAPKLKELGVEDPDLQWGQYVFPRPFDRQLFLRTLKAAENTKREELKPDGNRAIMFCSTTDPFQVIRNDDPATQRQLQAAFEANMTEALTLIRDHSTLRVRILTRSPLAKKFFPLMASFGPRLMFGMSIPTLDNELAKIYEPQAPAPTQRLATLKAAQDAGLNIYAAMAPTYPECTDTDLLGTLVALASIRVLTIFHEPINIRAENVERINQHARSLGRTMKTEVFDTTDTWKLYAMQQLTTVEKIANRLGCGNRLHLWPDKALNHYATHEWLGRWWNRISEWPL